MEYFAPEKPVYEECSQQDAREDNQEYVQPMTAEYGRLESRGTVHG